MVKADVPRPVQRNVKRVNDMRILPVRVMRRVVGELGERLPLERIPLAVEQRVPQLGRLVLKLDDVHLVDVRVVVNRRRDVFTDRLLGFHLPVLTHDLRVLDDRVRSHVR